MSTYLEGGSNSVVECNLAKVEVASSNLVSRSIFPAIPLLKSKGSFFALPQIPSLNHIQTGVKAAVNTT